MPGDTSKRTLLFSDFWACANKLLKLGRRVPKRPCYYRGAEPARPFWSSQLQRIRPLRCRELPVLCYERAAQKIDSFNEPPFTRAGQLHQAPAERAKHAKGQR